MRLPTPRHAWAYSQQCQQWVTHLRHDNPPAQSAADRSCDVWSYTTAAGRAADDTTEASGALDAATARRRGGQLRAFPATCRGARAGNTRPGSTLVSTAGAALHACSGLRSLGRQRSQRRTAPDGRRRGVRGFASVRSIPWACGWRHDGGPVDRRQCGEVLMPADIRDGANRQFSSAGTRRLAACAACAGAETEGPDQEMVIKH